MSKKVIPLICEGISDRIALEDYLNGLFLDKEVTFFVASGDILGNEEKYDEYLSELLEKAIFKNEFINSVPFSVDDILMVAQLIDTDGVFEDDSIVSQNKNINFTYYYDDAIEVKNNVKATIENRARRRERINDSVNTTHIIMKNKTFPYRIFYVSSNLEHLTQNNRNVGDNKEKINLANEFATRFNSNDFIEFIKNNNASKTYDYYESWNYIRRHSLEKATNLIIFIKELSEEIYDVLKDND